MQQSTQATSQAIGYQMTEDDVIRNHVIMRLMCDLEVTKTSIERKFKIDFDEYFDGEWERINALARDGLVIHDVSVIRVTAVGRLFLRNIAMCFDATLKNRLNEKPVFSRTV